MTKKVMGIALLILLGTMVFGEGQMDSSGEPQAFLLYSDMSSQEKGVLQEAINLFHQHRSDIRISQTPNKEEAHVYLTSLKQGLVDYNDGKTQSLQDFGLNTEEYLNSAYEALEADNELLGIPLFINFLTLFYRGSDTLPPMNSLEDFTKLNTQNQILLLNDDFDYLHWSLGSFGTDPLELDKQKSEDWLKWLISRENSSFIETYPNQTEVLQEAGERLKVYFTDWAENYPQLKENYKVMIAPLPGGPGGEARSLLFGEGLFFSAGLTPQELKTLLIFGQFLSSPLIEELFIPLGKIPANRNAASSGFPDIRNLQAQGESALAATKLEDWESLSEGMTNLVKRVLNNSLTPEDAAQLIK